MCARFTIVQDPGPILRLVGARPAASVAHHRPRYNVAPSQDVLTIVGLAGDEDHAAVAGEMRWGLIPRWVKDRKSFKLNLINARSETAAEKPAFRESLRHRRCLIPADGFYEWKSVPGQKRRQPYRITMKDEAVFAFAGLWDRWVGPDQEKIVSFAILTTTPNELVSALHDRMPVILDEEAMLDWLDPEIRDPNALAAFMTPISADLMTAYPVSMAVNSPANDGPNLIRPVH